MKSTVIESEPYRIKWLLIILSVTGIALGGMLYGATELSWVSAVGYNLAMLAFGISLFLEIGRQIWLAQLHTRDNFMRELEKVIDSITLEDIAEVAQRQEPPKRKRGRPRKDANNG